MIALDPLAVDLNGYTLIEASAGTGKTHTLTTLFVRLILEEGMSAEQILMVTYTRAATEELRMKIRRRLRDALAIVRKNRGTVEDSQLESLVSKLLGEGLTAGTLAGRIEAALLAAGEIPIFTIHGFCQRMLREFAFESMSPFASEVIPSQKEILLKGCREFVRQRLYRERQDTVSWIFNVLEAEKEGIAEVLSSLLAKLIAVPEPEIPVEFSIQEVTAEIAEFRQRAARLADRWKDRGGEFKTAFKEQLKAVICSFCEDLDAWAEISGRVPPVEPKGEKPEGAGEMIALDEEARRLLREGLEKEAERQIKELDQVFSFTDPEVLVPSQLTIPRILCPDRVEASPSRCLHFLFDRMISVKRGKYKDRFKSLREEVTALIDAWGGRKQGSGGSTCWASPLSADPLFTELMKFAALYAGIDERLKCAVVCEARSFVRRFMREYKQEAGLISYDDMLVLLRDALNRKPGGNRLAANIRRRYPVAMIDEFQDTDPIQWEIFSAVYDHPRKSRLFLIGDPKQSIYGFRGADIFTYLAAKNKVDASRRFRLTVNWRSAPDLVAAVNSLFRHKHQRPTFILEGIDYQDVDPRPDWSESIEVDGARERLCVEIWDYLPPDDEEKAEAAEAPTPEALTAGEVGRLIDLARSGRLCIRNASGLQRRVSPGDITILVRDFVEAGKIRKALGERWIPSVYYGPSSVFESEEAMEILYVMRAVSTPSDITALSTALATVMAGKTAHEIRELHHEQGLWDETVEKFEAFRRTWNRRGITAMLRAFMEEMGTPSRLLRLRDGERRLTNLRQLSELLGRAEEENPGMERLISWLCAQVRKPDTRSEEQQLRLETDENLVQVMTYHRSKGLEFPFLFLPFLGELKEKEEEPRIYFDPNRSRYVCRLCAPRPSTEGVEKRLGGLGSAGEAGEGRDDDGERLYTVQKQAELRRLIYVAATRAKYRLYLALTPGVLSSPFGAVMGVARQDYEKREETKDRLLESLFGRNPGVRIVSAKEKNEELSRLQVGDAFTAEERFPGRPLEPSKVPPAERVWVPLSFSSLNIMEGTSVAPVVTEKEEGGEGERSPYTFPRGAGAGNAMHELFEVCGFSWKRQRVREEAERILPEFGIDPDWSDVAADIFMNTVHAELLDSTGLTLAGLSAEWTAKEMPFSWSFDRGIKPGLADGRLPDGLQQGVMRGFIDLVFRHGDRFYVLDYKTNWLGPDADAYDREGLQQAMEDHGYFLQAAIYQRTLHSLLGDVLRDYSMERCLGGVFYLFVRALPTRGIFFIRTEELTRRFEALFREVTHA